MLRVKIVKLLNFRCQIQVGKKLSICNGVTSHLTLNGIPGRVHV